MYDFLVFRSVFRGGGLGEGFLPLTPPPPNEKKNQKRDLFLIFFFPFGGGGGHKKKFPILFLLRICWDSLTSSERRSFIDFCVTFDIRNFVFFFLIDFKNERKLGQIFVWFLMYARVGLKKSEMIKIHFVYFLINFFVWQQDQGYFALYQKDTVGLQKVLHFQQEHDTPLQLSARSLLHLRPLLHPPPLIRLSLHCVQILLKVYIWAYDSRRERSSDESNEKTRFNSSKKIFCDFQTIWTSARTPPKNVEVLSRAIPSRPYNENVNDQIKMINF